jgi:hypothetical protein
LTETAADHEDHERVDVDAGFCRKIRSGTRPTSSVSRPRTASRYDSLLNLGRLSRRTLGGMTGVLGFLAVATCVAGIAGGLMWMGARIRRRGGVST